MRQIVVLCEQPPHVPHREAHDWLRRSLGDVAALDSVHDVRLTILEHVERAPGPWRWLAGIALEDGTRPEHLLRRGPLAELVGDLRLVGMRPELLIVPDHGEGIPA